MWMSLETVTKWSVSERKKQIPCHIAYMWNLKKWYRRTYQQSRQRHRYREQEYGMDGGGGWTGVLGLTYIHYVQNR